MCLQSHLTYFTSLENFEYSVSKCKLLTLCHGVMYWDVIAMPCVVGGSHILTFLCTTSYTRVSQLFCITYRVKVINTLRQHAWISSYKHTDPSWPHILRTIWLYQGNHRFRYPVCFLSSLPPFEIMALRRSIMSVSYVWIHILMPDDFETEIWTVTVTFPHLLHVNS